MAFIEPRLIHLLNDSTTPQLARADLPPIRLAYSRPSERPFPLEPDTTHREDKTKASSLATSHGAPLAASRGVDDGFPGRDLRKEEDSTPDRGNAISSTAYMQLSLLVGEERDTEPSFSLRKILDEVPDSKDDPTNKKRHRAITTKDDFVQLPQPVKKQKPIQPQVMPAMPPIINGLHEPPPDAALFPPISSNDFNEPESNQLKPLRDFPQASEDQDAEKPVDADSNPSKSSKAGSGKTRKKAMKPRRKWSEAETNHLLLGVNRHGVGKWTDILADPDFNFNDRTAGDLKDRFRTCCPNELRRENIDTKLSSAVAPPVTAAEPKTKAKAKTGLLSENILISHEEVSYTDQSQLGQADLDGGPRTKKSRAHRKKLEDLAELGIHGPFKKSHRRERRPFTDQDDKQILEGLDKYGPAWTKIQRDPRFSLSGRQPTDLRDRVRNKYPSVYQQIEKGLFQIKDARGNDTLEPTISMSIANGLQSNRPAPMDAALNKTNSKEDLPKWPLSLLDNGEPAIVQQAFDFSEPVAAAFMGSADKMGKGLKKHQKRLSAPSHWLLDKLSGTYAPRPSAGPHKLRDCLPLIVFLRNRLKYALNYRETRAITMQRLIKVDGKIRTDITYPTGFMDVITIEKTGENFRLIYDTKGRFTVHRIQAEEAEYKLGKVKRVQLGRGGIPFLVTHDARTIRYPDPLIKVNDTVKIDLKTGKIQDFIKFDTGSIAMVTGGRNMGRVGVITHRERHDGGFNIVHIKDAIDNTFATRESNVFVIGSEKPWISLPKGKGVKLTIAEERDRRRANALAGN
ncbi:40S ribosomal protein S4 [Colletotrichum sidae]|uniref:40S ribosomal protein S4 n=1 Tax=Colletotrichum sidae TaxID=1347389 RepID=A0A4R8TNR6_9PEZI|nr:40S ribosomal protein S4 [Colletotrichum sidae]